METEKSAKLPNPNIYRCAVKVKTKTYKIGQYLKNIWLILISLLTPIFRLFLRRTLLFQFVRFLKVFWFFDVIEHHFDKPVIPLSRLSMKTYLTHCEMNTCLTKLSYGHCILSFMGISGKNIDI